NSERWLLTYADLITLLLGLFVILYAMSKIDTEKYSQVVAALGGVFGSPEATSVKLSVVDVVKTLPEFYRERARIEADIRKGLNLGSKSLPISITQDERGVTVHLQEQFLFASGSADLKATSLATLDQLAEALKKMTNDVRVEGHTDNVPIATGAFPSNWHLSVGRAVNVGYYLIGKHGIKADKVSVVGYSEYRPLAPNTSDENRARNRRVDIVIVAESALKKDEAATPEQQFMNDSMKEKQNEIHQ
ncbi:MAG: OmpA family protein, partial [Ignavibacteriales bacterium]|nr:OmpA family protein [Ignavibacteriales bacterium]